jgi:Ser/Thr protein kinase RdoA (MazF antagonist)
MIDVIGYMDSIYNWDVSQTMAIPTKYATNSNYRIKHNEHLYFLKMYTSKSAFTIEKFFLKALRQTGSTPEIINDFDGDENNTASIILPYYSTFKALDAETINELSDIAFIIGRELKKVHVGEAPAQYFGRVHKPERFNSWREYLEIRLFHIKELYEKHNIPIVNKVYCKIEKSLADVPNNVTPCYIHSDLNPDNILFDRGSNKILFVDFERSYLGHCEMDFPKLFWRCFKFNNDFINSFYEGYGMKKNSKYSKLYQSIFFIDLLSYLINLSTPSNEDTETITEILEILKTGEYA